MDRRHCLLACLLGPCAGLGAANEPPNKPSSTRTITWEELIPKGWDPLSKFRKGDTSLVPEGSAKEMALMQEMREIWDNAPTRADLAGARVRLPGYVVPLDPARGGRISQFLLVPYFGACIHTPPPPANQIVFVRVPSPVAVRSMAAVWVTGTLGTQRADSSMGVTGYTMAAQTVEPYRAPQ